MPDTNPERVSQRLTSLANSMTENQNAKLKLRAWIGDYDGKIIEFHVDDSAFHMVFTKENARFEEGPYPSPEVIIETDSDYLMNILLGKIRLSSTLLIESKLSVWGNFHDFVAFTKITSSLKNATE